MSLDRQQVFAVVGIIALIAVSLGVSAANLGSSAGPSPTSYNLFSAELSKTMQLQDFQVSDISWSNDGTRLYELGQNRDKLFQYAVSDPWDISTATLQTSLEIDNENPSGMAWNNDGSKLYISVNEGSTGVMKEYQLSNSFDVSSASLTEVKEINQRHPRGMSWSTDGSKAYVISRVGEIHEYNAGDSFSISSISFLQTLETNRISTGMAWSGDGSRLYVISTTEDRVYEYNVSSSFDVSTASLLRSMGVPPVYADGIAWGEDGQKLYIAGASGENKLYQYNLT